MDNLSEIKGIMCQVLSWRADTLTIHLFHSHKTNYLDKSARKTGRFYYIK